MNILTDIDTCIIGLKYNDKHKGMVSQIKSQVGTVIFKLTFKYWKHYHNFVPFKFYGSNIYKWEHRLSKNYPYGLHTKPILIKKHE